VTRRRPRPTLFPYTTLFRSMLTLGLRPLAIIVQLTRSAMLDVLGQDYIRTAKAKGLSSNRIIYKHALKNALNPVVTAVSGWFASDRKSTRLNSSHVKISYAV